MRIFTPMHILALRYINFIEFEVLTAAVLKSADVWDITPSSPLNVNRRFGETYRPIFSVEEWAKQEASVKAGGKQGSAYLYLINLFIN
jgi:hypothetical protein